MKPLKEFEIEVQTPVRNKKGVWVVWARAEVVARTATTAIRLAQESVARRRRVRTAEVECTRLKLVATATGEKERVVKVQS